ncbi:MAG: hypothetical protein H9855_02900 [Candidatus Acinetobacter avistercoris]|nr:hypothetical protein [Candidatus Acinetobacter avistercoris]
MSEKEIAIIPKGSYVSIMGCSYLLLEDTNVDGNQTYLNDALKAQSDYRNGVGVCSGSGTKNINQAT